MSIKVEDVHRLFADEANVKSAVADSEGIVEGLIIRNDGRVVTINITLDSDEAAQKLVDGLVQAGAENRLPVLMLQGIRRAQ